MALPGSSSCGRTTRRGRHRYWRPMTKPGKCWSAWRLSKWPRTRPMLAEAVPLAAVETSSAWQCPACVAVRRAWRAGGYHLCCRACEVKAVIGADPHRRQAFYGALLLVDGFATKAKWEFKRFLRG